MIANHCYPFSLLRLMIVFAFSVTSTLRTNGKHLLIAAQPSIYELFFLNFKSGCTLCRHQL